MKFNNTPWSHHGIGIAIALANLALVLNAAWFFLFIAEFPVSGWLFFNICTPSVAVFLAGFILKRTEVMACSVPLLAFWGGGGLFLFGWRGTMLFAQAGHIAMVLAAGYVIYIVLREKEWKKAITGAIFGSVVLAAVFPVQQSYVRAHPELVKKMGDPVFQKHLGPQ